MMVRLRGFLGLILAGTALTCPARAAYTFTSFTVPTAPGQAVNANAISNSGAVVGFTVDGAMNATNFVRNADGTFSAPGLPTGSMANGINSSPTIVGADGTNAFSFTNGVLTHLPAPNPGNTTSEVAFGVNDGGTIVGQYVDSAAGKTPGFVDANGTFTVLNPTTGSLVTNAQAINSNGLVTGFFAENTNGVNQHGFLYDTLTKTYTTIADPSTALTQSEGLTLTQFLGLNDNGKAVGYYQTGTGSQHGFLYDIPTQTYTFLDDPNAPTSGVSITQITGINDFGTITGFYVDPNGAQVGFVAAVPEPGSMALLGLGLAGTVGYARRRKARVC